MNWQRLLALYHYCSGYHGGQFSREYRILSKLTMSPYHDGYGLRLARSEEHITCLADPENVEARSIYRRLVKAHQKGDMGSGYVNCACCGLPTIADCIEADRDVEVCSACEDAGCVPHEGCNIPDEESEENHDDLR